jgi:hypothetical protein
VTTEDSPPRATTDDSQPGETAGDSLPAKGLRLFRGLRLLYQQIVVPVIAVFAMITFFSHFHDFQWRGFLASLIGQWDGYVRPAMKWLCQVLVTTPLSWVGWHVQVPLWLRDYLSVGLALGLAFVRSTTWQRGRRAVDVLVRPEGPDTSWRSYLLYWPPAMLVTWPLATTILLIAFITFLLVWPVLRILERNLPQRTGEPDNLDAMVKSNLRFAPAALAPLLYFALLLLINRFLM